jgi:hypothetical protein
MVPQNKFRFNTSTYIRAPACCVEEWTLGTQIREAPSVESSESSSSIMSHHDESTAVCIQVELEATHTEAGATTVPVAA